MKVGGSDFSQVSNFMLVIFDQRFKYVAQLGKKIWIFLIIAHPVGGGLNESGGLEFLTGLKLYVSDFWWKFQVDSTIS